MEEEPRVVQNIEYQHFYNCITMVNAAGEEIDIKKPIVTICYIRSETATVVGIAICSEKDNPCKKVGRSIPYKRAIYAAHKGGLNLPVSRSLAYDRLIRCDINLNNNPFLGLGKSFHVENPTFRFTRQNNN